tara:strand:+ start:1221 stop:2867 length:1647 start_codon:yes stop_codon:yes gene_type:complete
MAIAESFLYLFQADTSSLIKGEKEAEKQNKKLDAGLKETDKTSHKMAGSFGNLIATAGGALTALLSFAALSKGISQTSDYVDNLSKTADMYGISANELAAYQEIIVKANGSVSGFQSVISNLNGSFKEFITTGNTGILPYMQQLGISMVDAEGKAKNVLDTLPEIADAFSKMSKAESSGFGKKLGFDDSLILSLQQGREEIEKQVSAQKKLFSITKEQTDIFAKFKNTVSDTQTSFRGLFVTLGAEILPVVGYLMAKIQDGIGFMSEHKDLMKGIFIALGVAITAFALPAIVSFGAASIVAFAPFYLIGAAVAGAIALFAILYEDISVFLSNGSSAFGDFLKYLGLSNDAIKSIRDAIVGLGSAISNSFGFAIYFIQEFFKLGVQVAGDVFNAFKPLLNFFSVTLTKAIEGVFGFVDSLIENIKKALVFMGLLKDEEAEKNQTERFTAQKQFTNNLPDGVTAENVQYYTKDELSKLREQQNSGINNTTSNMVSSSSSASRQSTSNINIDKIDISTQATSTDQISREISTSLTNQLKKTTATYEDGIEA